MLKRVSPVFTLCHLHVRSVVPLCLPSMFTVPVPSSLHPGPFYHYALVYNLAVEQFQADWTTDCPCVDLFDSSNLRRTGVPTDL